MEQLPRGRYTQELKQQAVNMVVVDGFGVAETARRLSLCSKTLGNWVKQYRQDAQGLLAKSNVSEQAAEMARLRKEVAQLRMERDILKKAMAYFAKESL
jgi:transposase